MDPNSIKALTFDIFGTVVDWRSTIIREGQQLGAAKGIDLDWARFADAWRAGYQPAMQRVRTGELPWQTIDALHRLLHFVFPTGQGNTNLIPNHFVRTMNNSFGHILKVAEAT